MLFGDLSLIEEQIRTGYCSLADAILGALAEPNNPLALSLIQNHGTESELLLSTGSPLVTAQLGHTPLHLLALQPPSTDGLHTFQLLNFFMNFSKNHLEYRNAYGQTPLLCAVDSGNETVAKFGVATLHDRLTHRMPSFPSFIVRILLENGAELDTVDIQGHTPLSLALHRDARELVRMLYKPAERSPHAHARALHASTHIIEFFSWCGGEGGGGE